MFEMLSSKGVCWTKIAQRLDRTPSNVRNKFQRLTRDLNGDARHAPAVNRCKRCGELKRSHVCSLGARPNASWAIVEAWRTDMILEAVAAHVSGSESVCSAR